MPNSIHPMYSPAHVSLEPEQQSFYNSEGYLVVENLLSDEEIAVFLAHEESHQDKPRLGLRTHLVDCQWKALVHHPAITGVVEQLLSGMPRIVQSMYLPKMAEENSAGIAFHQDTHYLPNTPPTLMAAWIALSDTGEDNGGLCVVPGSHREGLRQTHQTSGEEHITWTHQHLMRDPEGKEWTEEFHSFEIDNLDPATLKKLFVPKGGSVFFTGMTIHGSYANRSSNSIRLAFATHYVRDGTWVYRADVQETIPVQPPRIQ